MNAQRKAWLVMIGMVFTELTPLLFLNRNWPRFSRLIGLYPGSNHGTALGWLFAVVVGVFYIVMTLKGIPFVREHFLDVNVMKIATVFVFAPVAAVFEEVYFRKVLMDTMASHQFRTLSQIAASAIVFGLAHAMWSVFAGRWRVGRNAACATGVLGGLLAAVYLVSARSLLPVIVAHLLINACIEPWLVLAATSRVWGGTDPHFDR